MKKDLDIWLPNESSQKELLKNVSGISEILKKALSRERQN